MDMCTSVSSETVLQAQLCIQLWAYIKSHAYRHAHLQTPADISMGHVCTGCLGHVSFVSIPFGFMYTGKKSLCAYMPSHLHP